MSLQRPHRDPHEAAVVWEDLGVWENHRAGGKQHRPDSTAGLEVFQGPPPGRPRARRKGREASGAFAGHMGCYRVRELRTRTPCGSPTKQANSKAEEKDGGAKSAPPNEQSRSSTMWCSRSPAGRPGARPSPERLAHSREVRGAFSQGRGKVRGRGFGKAR